MGSQLEAGEAMKLAICGHGNAGKDEVANILTDLLGLEYHASTSEFAANIVFDWWGKDHYESVHLCWHDRRNHREKWRDIIREYNTPDPLRFYRDCLANQDALVGVRTSDDLRACRDAGLCDLWLWVERAGYKSDPTMEFTANDCDVTIVNNGTVHDLRLKLNRLASFLL